MRLTRLRLKIVASALTLVVACLGFASVVSADAYGTASYGSCSYATGCPRHTVTQTPSGLQIAVNLTDGQVIPATKDGYTITITPLNGSGSSFTNAVITIDGQQVHTGAPDSDGTARWPWETLSAIGKHHIVITVTDASNQSTTQEFNVTVTTASTAPGSGSRTSSNSGGNDAGSKPSGHSNIISRVLGNISDASVHLLNTSKSIIHNLPGGIVFAFPWALFVLVAIEIGGLLLQTKRELHEQRILEALAKREREMAELKRTFAELVSHYLRTPLTIIRSGAEMLTADSSVPAAVGTSLQQTANQLAQTIENLVAEVTTGSADLVAGTGQVEHSRFKRVSRQIALWFPVAMVGFIAFGFGYLANHVSRFHANTLNMLSQVLFYGILTLILYQSFRRLQLRKRDAAHAQTLVEKEQSIQAEQDHFIQQAVGELKTTTETLQAQLTQLPPQSKSAVFVKKGAEQLKTTYDKLLIASLLHGSRSEDPYAPVTAQTLFEDAWESMQAAAQAKSVQAHLVRDAQLSAQNRSLLGLVLRSLFDNAITFSAAGDNIEVTPDAHEQLAQITITDHGKGISPDKLEFISKPFFKAEGAEDFTHEGMGFSLYLDKLIMAYLGGDVVLDSEPNKGTVVTIRWATL